MAPVSPLPEIAVCLHCGYSLRGLPENVCPECGRGFDPADRRTWYDSTGRSTLLRLARRWSYPPPAWHSVLTASSTCVLLICASYSPFNWMISAEVSVWLASLGFALLVSYALRALSCRRYRRGVRAAGSWLVGPICGCLLVGALLYPWPLAWRFAVSRPWFDQAARAAQLQQPDKRERRLGLIRVYRITRFEPDRVKFVCNGLEIYWDAREIAESPHYAARLANNWFLWSIDPTYPATKYRTR